MLVKEPGTTTPLELSTPWLIDIAGRVGPGPIAFDHSHPGGGELIRRSAAVSSATAQASILSVAARRELGFSF
jgi:hypothetical protein